MPVRARNVFMALACALAALPANGADDPRALHRAVARNDLVAADDLLGARPEYVNSRFRDGIAPLHLAAAANRKIMASLLLCHGADPHARTDSGFTPLHWAASRDAAETTALLLQWGANLHAATDTGVTPLHWAAGKNATNAVALLIERGASLNALDATGFAPLDWAVKHDAHDTAFLIAARLAVRDMAQDVPTRAATPIRPEPFEDDTSARKPDEPPEIFKPVDRPRVEPGRTLSVPLGRGIEMTFVWIESLGLWMGEYETTNEQYRRFVPAHSSRFRESFSLDDDRQPVVYVSWHEARAFAAWLNKNVRDNRPQGFEFRLPTEKEWVETARCGDHRLYPWGRAWPPRYGNYSDATARKNLSNWRGIENYDDGYPVSCPVEQSGVNDWGVYGMGGNVWEWCEDWYDDSQTHKVRKGGSWDYDPRHALLIDWRGMDLPTARSDTVGFRLVVAPVTRP